MDKLKFYVTKCFKQDFANFKGRARREEFWYFVLADVLVGVVCSIIGIISSGLGNLLSGIAGLAFIVPMLAVGARRLHDTGKSGWLQLLCIIPVIGTIILIVFFAKEGDSQANSYGPNPKA